MKTVLRGKFIALNVYIRKEERSEINLSFHLIKLEKEEQFKPKASKIKEVIKIRGEVNEIKNRKTIEKINETKNGSFRKINKIDRPLARLTKKKKKTQITNIRNLREFPGAPVVKNPPSNAGDPGSISGRGTKIPRATGQLSQCALEPAHMAAKIPSAATKTRRSQINKY